jgi:hypothetical protein
MSCVRFSFHHKVVKERKPEVKKKFMKRVVISLLTMLAACSIRADIIWQETFNYSNGPVSITSTNGTGSTTISNWITHSGNIDQFVNNKRLEVSSSSANGPLQFTRSGDTHRFFSTTAGSPYTNAHQLLYAGFIINFTNLPTANGAYFAHFYVSSTTFPGRLWALTGNPAATSNNFSRVANTFRLGVSASDGQRPFGTLALDLATNTDYQIVMGWDPVTLDAVTVWVNPTSPTDPSVTSGDAFNPTAANIVNGFGFRQATGFGGFTTISNLVLATTFDEALTNVLSTNAVAPKIVYQPAGATNFVGSTVDLSAVAIGQGQASLNYQWYQGVNPYSNPGGNTNVLTIANAQASDSGNYSVVVTTPYGLSVTSAVAKVLISAAPIPPVFVTQPVSKTAFTNDTVTLTTSVSSPGNVTFTWYSNNVVVTDGVISGSSSSSLTLNNVLTNFSAAYKVAVTNDVVANGIVSSNAVVTVIEAPKVSIAYLRTLIDPTTFQSTNVPITLAYQATGVITSFTNTTTGNTASYYLQDATAGINIFATFGSTFRPQQGDVVTFTGVLSYFTAATGGLELLADPTTFPYTSYSIVSNGFPVPAGRTIPFTVTNTYGYLYVNTNLMGSRLTLTNVYFGTNAGSILSSSVNQAVTVTNENGAPFTLQFYFQDLDTAGQALPAYASSVTGNLIGGHPNVFLAVTKWSDIVTNLPVVPIPLGIGYSGGNLTFTWSDPSFDLQSATNVVGPYVTIPGATSGFTTNTAAAQMYFRLFHP